MARSDWIGESLSGRYEIIELLGQGGMSAVYKANDPNLRRIVAVKIIHSHLSEDVEFVHRFEEEAAAVAQLRHPNLIQVFDFNHDNKTYYIVFEFVPGETVQERLKRRRAADQKMDINAAVNIVAQTADGLHYAHNKGLIHRDIKPANIMINVQNTPIIMDFGIAKIMGGTQHTATGAVLGTARYMSPEQIKGEHIDPRTDIYSLGITMFEMLGGRPPFNADSAMTLMMMHITDPVPDLRNLRADVPMGLVAVVNKALAKDPDDRFRTAAEFAAALRNHDSVDAEVIAFETGSTEKLDPEKTIVEPLATAAALADAASTTGAEQAAAPPPAARPVPEKTESGSSSSPNWLLIGGGALAALLLLVGIWAVFLRNGGDGGAEPAASTSIATEAAEVVVAPTDEPATEEPSPTAEPTIEPTIAPSATAVIELPPQPAASVASSSGNVVLVVDGEETPVDADTTISAGAELITGEGGEATFELEDGSLVQIGESSHLRIVELADDPDDSEQKSILTLLAGDFLLRQPEPGNILELWGAENNLLGSLQAVSSSSAAPKEARAAARMALQEAPAGAAMAINLGSNLDEVRISCFAGLCIVGDEFVLERGEEIVVDTVAQALVSQETITDVSASYQFWQAACSACLPQVAAAIVEGDLATATSAPPTAVPATATTEAPPTTAPPTATTVTQPTPTLAAPTAEPTATVAPTEAPAQLFVQITGIALQDGRYIVSYETTGYTEQLPGQHVHFYFDTVAEANAGSPGSGPWKLYGGPRPFTEYAQSDNPGNATAMCARVANPDHSIIYGSGNCYPLPQ